MSITNAHLYVHIVTIKKLCFLLHKGQYDSKFQAEGLMLLLLLLLLPNSVAKQEGRQRTTCT